MEGSSAWCHHHQSMPDQGCHITTATHTHRHRHRHRHRHKRRRRRRHRHRHRHKHSHRHKHRHRRTTLCRQSCNRKPRPDPCSERACQRSNQVPCITFSVSLRVRESLRCGASNRASNRTNNRTNYTFTIQSSAACTYAVPIRVRTVHGVAGTVQARRSHGNSIGGPNAGGDVVAAAASTPVQPEWGGALVQTVCHLSLT